MAPTVSVVIPAYRCDKYLAAAIESALNQISTPVEVVVINDGSPDDTDAVISPYLPRVRYIKQENRGLSAARNRGFEESTGRFVCFLDADDLLLPGKCAAQLSVFEGDPSLGVVISGYEDVEEDGDTLIQTVEKPWHRDGLERLLNHESFPCHAALVRREVLLASSMFPENIARDEYQEDWQLWLDLALAGVEFGSVPTPLCRYRNRPGSGRQRLLRHNDGARRVVQWLSSEPRAQSHQGAIRRLVSIVEMERAALYLRLEMLGEARMTLGAAVAREPLFWRTPESWFRLFLRSLSLEEMARWGRDPNPAWFEQVVLRGLLTPAEGFAPQVNVSELRSVARLVLVDLYYAKGDHRSSKQQAWQALREWPRVMAVVKAFPQLVRSILGPRQGRWVGSLRRCARRIGWR